ncbi:hypothetical protein SAMN02745146_0475 [Hymenobacter daecheongensis DSM 21074]|uniref:DUF4401 domain-containing protein n=1 Tax=Hymenobacter daecheongensis DSM 21074 TaxID=1121955 RepID=A0A1M6A445_9BACT|nr:hypothetical protein [Hymenobacter daecheongensis]SHI30923.1 hypothetical protein SAMN02745146_0475 [Hymenobacter daecheongensis DSM 21074]
MNVKAYPTAWPYAEAVQKLARRWQRQQLISAPQMEAIKAAYPLSYYRPHVFIRVGLFVFTLFGCCAAAGLIPGLLGFQNFNFILLALLCAGGSLLLLEHLIRESQLYHSGSDNALLYFSLTCLIFAVFYAVGEATPAPYRASFSLTNPFLLLALLPTLGLLMAAVIRYADRWVAAVTYCTYLLLVAGFLLQFAAGRLVLSFAIMLASAAAYALVLRLARRPDYLYYKPCFDLLKALALITFYLGGNYLVVREGNAALSALTVSRQVPFAPLFHFFTAGIPLLYIVVGLRRPHRTWLIVGLLALAFSLYTLRFYRALLPPEIAATLAGAVLISLTVWAFRYLRTPRHGLSAAAEGDENKDSLLNLESLVVAQTAHAPTPQPRGFEFGGGSSGGGGADGKY